MFCLVLIVGFYGSREFLYSKNPTRFKYQVSIISGDLASRASLLVP